jgi:hypothetical protein
MRLVVAYQMLGYGTTIRYGARRGAEGGPLPGGEGDPPLDHWLALWASARLPHEKVLIVAAARSELAAWKRRPDPPPEGETGQEMIERLIHEGEGWTARDVALAFRCTPSLVRRWRIEHERNPDTGRAEGTIEQAKDLMASGKYTLRQVAMLTGIPKSTLHDHLDRAA